MRGARITTQEHPDEARPWTVLGLRSDVCGELMVAAVVDPSTELHPIGFGEDDWSMWDGTYTAPTPADAARMAIADCAAYRTPEDLDDATGEPLHS